MTSEGLLPAGTMIGVTTEMNATTGMIATGGTSPEAITGEKTTVTTGGTTTAIAAERCTDQKIGFILVKVFFFAHLTVICISPLYFSLWIGTLCLRIDSVYSKFAHYPFTGQEEKKNDYCRVHFSMSEMS
jgi:hypothetical protein